MTTGAGSAGFGPAGRTGGVGADRGSRLGRRRWLALCASIGLGACVGSPATPRPSAADGSARPAPTPTEPPRTAGVVAPLRSPPDWEVFTPVPAATSRPPTAVPTPVDPERVIGTVAVEGTYAYVGVGSRLVVVDVADPARPVEVGRTAPFPAAVRAVAARGGHVYLGLESRRDGVHPSGRGVRVLDTSDPTRPREVGTFDDLRSGMVFALSGRYLYAADWDRGLRVIDVGDPARPVEAGYYAQGHVDRVAAADGRAYVDDSGRDLRVLDVADPTRISQVALVPIGGFAAMALEGGTLALSGPWQSLTFLDVSGRGAPTRLGTYDTQRPLRLMSQSYVGIRRAGRYVYARNQVRGGVDVIDAGDPRRPVLEGHLNEPTLPRGDAYGDDVTTLVPVGRMLFRAAANSLIVLDASSPTQPREVGRVGL
jgi:hypothetical protein